MSSFVVVLAQTSEAVGQQVIGNSRLNVTYAQDYFVDTILKKVNHEKFILQIGDNVTRFYSLHNHLADSITAAERAQHQQSGKADGSINTYKWFQPNASIRRFDVYSNYPHNGIVTLIRRFTDHTYRCSEVAPVMIWQVANESKTVLGYNCFKATTKMWGRTWNAWFTIDIPYSYGPYKFRGLPGLIMQISDDQGFISFSAISINQKISPILAFDNSIKTATRKQMIKLEAMLHEDPVSLYLANGAGKVFTQQPDGSYVPAKPGDKKYPYIPPIELE